MANDGTSLAGLPPRRGRPIGQLQPEDKQRKYRGQRKFSVKEIKDALQRNYGNCYMAAKALNDAEQQRGGTRTIDRRTITYHVRTRPELKTLADEGREEIFDVAEQTIFQAIRDGNASLAMKYLETQSKGRGYSRDDVVELLTRVDFRKFTVEQISTFFDPAKFTAAQAAKLFCFKRVSDQQLDAMIKELSTSLTPEERVGIGSDEHGTCEWVS